MGAPRIDRLEKNYIINGGMDFWQRGVSGTVSGFLADRFLFQNVTSAGTFTRTRSTDVPSVAESGYRSSYSDLITVGTADASLAGDERAFYSHVIEGFNLQRLLGKKVTLSFWVKCSKTGTQSVAFNNGNGTGGPGFVSYVATYTINAANTWEKKVITILMDTSGTWGVGNGYGLNVSWSLATSLTNQYATGTANQWISAPTPFAKYHFTGNLNLFDTAAATWRIAQIQLVEGEVETEFTPAGRNYADELRLCQRYYEKSYDIDVVPGTNLGGSANGGAEFFSIMGGLTINNDGRWQGGRFRTRKRAVPVVNVWSVLGVADRSHNFNAGVDLAATTAQPLSISENNFMVRNLSGGAITATGPSFQLMWHWAADAEL